MTFDRHLNNSAAVSSYPSSSIFTMHTLPSLSDSLLSLVEAALISLEARFLLVVKGAKDYFFLSTIVALVKAKLWPVQAFVYKKQVVERVLSFAQNLFSRHATCEHLGNPGMGSFKNNQVCLQVSYQLSLFLTHIGGCLYRNPRNGRRPSFRLRGHPSPTQSRRICKAYIPCDAPSCLSDRSCSHPEILTPF